MNSARFDQIEMIAREAIALEPAARDQFLDSRCGDDAELRAEVATHLSRSIASDESATVMSVPDMPPRIGPYEIEHELGRGGMGVVYLARDTVLDRPVAIKMLPADFARDRGRLARFEREARLLASLNHPNVAIVHGLEEIDGNRYLVLEYVDGETIGARLHRATMSIEDVLEVGRQVSDGIAAAHERGVIHRDLKPQNVKISSTGLVKVLDFGIAKALIKDTDVSQTAPTSSQVPASHDRTEPGMVIGTASYMSPEQARGEAVDGRTDVWSFGCLLFEMLVGVSPFRRATAAECIAATLNDDPDWDRLPNEARGLRQLLQRCLTRDPRRRLHAIADARIELEDLLAQPAGPQPRGVASALASPVRFSIELPPGLATSPHSSCPLAVSPDGTRIIMAVDMAVDASETAGGLYCRKLDDPESRLVPGTEGGWNPFVSPDGTWLGFLESAHEVVPCRVPIDGGNAVPIASHRTTFGPAWGPTRHVYFTDKNALLGASECVIVRVHADGGAIEPVTSPSGEDGDHFHYFPEPLPGGRTLLYISYPDAAFDADRAKLWAHDLATGHRKLILEGVAIARYTASGHLLVGRGNTLQVARFDLDRLKIDGRRTTVLEGLQRSASGGLGFACSPGGTLAFVTGSSFFEQVRSIVWVDPGSTLSEIPRRGPFVQPRISPDGKRIALTQAVRYLDWDVWIIDVERQMLSRLTRGGACSDPVWTPDGRRIAFSSRAAGTNRSDLSWISADGSDDPELLVTMDSLAFPTDISPNGQELVFNRQRTDGKSDVWIISLDVDRTPRPLLDRSFSEFGARFSPNGRWLAYTSDDSGTLEVYARAYPDLGRKVQISTDGGTSPVWSRDGRFLYYRCRAALMAVELTDGDDLRPSTPRTLLQGAFEEFGSLFNSQNYDIAPDGQRFLMIRNDELHGANRVNVVLNWFEELAATVVD